jgi:hypothetical protein
MAEAHRPLRQAQGRSFVGSHARGARLRCLRMTRQIKGDGQECPSYTGKGWNFHLNEYFRGNSETARQAANVFHRQRTLAAQNLGDQGFVLEHIQKVFLLKAVRRHEFL